MQKVIDIIYLAVSKLVLYEHNARQHSQKQIQQLANWIKQVGFINPIIIDRNNVVIAGHGRLLAAIQLDLESLPCIRVDNLSDNEILAYRLADNKLAENASWDNSLLTVELTSLQNFDVNYDFATLGFDSVEVDMLLHHPSSNDEESTEIIPAPSKTPISQPGDIFHCGYHRVGCGDCRDDIFMRKLMKRSKANICVTDPPYNVPIPGHVRGKGKTQFEDFAMACGEMTSDEFTQFLSLSFLNLKRVSKDGSLFYLFCDWRHLAELFTATDELFTDMLNLCVWNKSNGGMGSLYRSKHELVGVFKHGKAPHTNNIQLGKHGRDRTNVWDYPGLSSFSKQRSEELALHATPKPVPLLKDILLDASKPNDIVIDGFLGSGSTLIAAEKVRRRCFGIEIDPKYVDVILNRYRNDTGNEPIHVNSGLTFSELSTRRSPAKGGSK